MGLVPGQHGLEIGWLVWLVWQFVDIQATGRRPGMDGLDLLGFVLMCARRQCAKLRPGGRPSGHRELAHADMAGAYSQLQ